VTALRVYEPLEAFAAGERPALAALAEDPDAGQDAEVAERRAAWRRLLGRPDAPSGRGRSDDPPSAAPAGGEQAHGATDAADVGDAGDVGAGRDAVEASPADAGRGAAVRTGGRVHARVLRAEGLVLLSPVAPATPDAAADDARPGHALVQAWELPVAWLTVVRSEDLTRSGGPGRYVLPMARARARAARALKTLRSGLGEVDVTAEVEELARWLEGFHPRSWIELDTRPVAALAGGEDGADDVRLGLESLTAGDAAGVAAAYQRVSKRSHRLEQLSVSS
jgi:hypothetical protein